MERAGVAALLSLAAVFAVIFVMGSVSDESTLSETQLQFNEAPEDDFVEMEDAALHKTLSAIVSLRAYSKLAIDKAVDFKNDHGSSSDTALVNFVVIFGAKSDKENVVSAYADSMGKAKGLFPGGIGAYLLMHLSKAIHDGQDVTTAFNKHGRKVIRLSSKSLGLDSSPDYFQKLAVSQASYIGLRLKVESANSDADAQAAAAWLRSGQKNQYKSFKSRAEDAVEEKKAEYEKELTDEALQGIKDNYAKTGNLEPLPNAGTSGADTVKPLTLPSQKEVDAAAAAAANKWVNDNKEDAAKKQMDSKEEDSTKAVTDAKAEAEAEKKTDALASATKDEDLKCGAEGKPSAQFCSGDSCFVIVGEKTDHADAECQCRKLGGNLACFANKEAEAAVVTQWKAVTDVNSWDAKLWFGASDAAKEGSWTCGGNGLAYTNWRSGEPNNVGGEDCAEVAKYGGYKWEDMKCTRQLPFVCSVPKTVKETQCLIERNHDYLGGDLSGKQIKNVASAEKCSGLCAAEPKCKSWTYGKKPGQSYTKTCFMKHSVKPGRKTSDCCDSGMPCKKETPKATPALVNEGHGCCRFTGWKAKGHGYQTIDQCKALCKSDATCTAVDMARPKNGKYDCYTFTGDSSKGFKTQCNTGDTNSHCYRKA